MLGTCLRCGAAGPVELDHPTGTVRGRHLHPGFVAPMCLACHRLRSLVDSRLDLEGATAASLWLVVRRLAAWTGCLAMAGAPVTFPAEVLSALARVLEDVADELANEKAP